MKVMITGTEGFVGPYLIEEMKSHGHEVVGLTFSDFDICDTVALENCLQNEAPEAVIHLAGLSGYEQCLKDPINTWNVNTLAVESLATLLATICPGSRLLFVSSGKIYAPSSTPLKEDDELKPADFYALSKMAADIRLGQLDVDLTIIRARAFNHTGPGQALGFLCPDLIDRLKKQEDEAGDMTLFLGSLSAPVDLSDVRDVVRAYRLLVETAPSGAYNVGQGSVITVADVVTLLEKVVGRSIKATEKGEWKRSYSETIRSSNIEKITLSCGWSPEIPLKETLENMWKSVG